jgi:hypothetical protein
LRSLKSSWRRETQALPTSRGQKKVADLLEKKFYPFAFDKKFINEL